MLAFYGYKNCSTCRNAEKFLKAQDIAYKFIDITETPPSAKELTTMVANSGLELKKFLNTSGEVYRDLGLKDKLKAMSEKDLIELMAKNGRLIKRPLIADKTKATVGFKEEQMDVWL